MDTLTQFRRRSWLRLRHSNRVVVCDRCGEVQPLPENCNIDQFVGLVQEFAGRHSDCKADQSIDLHGDRQQGISTLN